MHCNRRNHYCHSTLPGGIDLDSMVWSAKVSDFLPLVGAPASTKIPAEAVFYCSNVAMWAHYSPEHGRVDFYSYRMRIATMEADLGGRKRTLFIHTKPPSVTTQSHISTLLLHYSNGNENYNLNVLSVPALPVIEAPDKGLDDYMHVVNIPIREAIISEMISEASEALRKARRARLARQRVIHYVRAVSVLEEATDVDEWMADRASLGAEREEEQWVMQSASDVMPYTMQAVLALEGKPVSGLPALYYPERRIQPTKLLTR